jgi:quinol monooxygenase YgiN
LAAPFDRRPSSGFLVAACIVLLQRLVAISRQDAGAVRFDALQQDSRPNHFTLIEVWRDCEAHQRHRMADHARAFRRELTPLLGALYDERVYKPLR